MPGEAAHFEEIGDGRIRCRLCPHACALSPGETGECLTRRNVGGALDLLAYGRLRAAAVDPIEKKPLAHYRPGSLTFSVASAGCNLVCPFCQNHGLSQCLRDLGEIDRGREWEPVDVVRAAEAEGCASISFTYSEPILSFEFARDVASLARPEGLEIVFVTNGQVSPAPARDLAAFLGAANVDLKCFSEADYRDVLGGSLSAVLRAIEILAAGGVWIEVTTLVIPGFNDRDDQLAEVARFVAGIDRSIPWHVSRFHPDYRWIDRPPTPAATISRAREIGRAEGLAHVYSGNLPGDDGERTHCPECGEVVVDRVGYAVREIRTREGRCPSCGAEIAGVGLP